MTRPAPSISPLHQFLMSGAQFFPFHGEQRKGCQFESERALIGDGKNCWLAGRVSRCRLRCPGSYDRGPALCPSEPGLLPALGSAARALITPGCPVPAQAPLLPCLLGRFLMRPVGLRKPPKTGWSQWVFSHWNAQVFSRLKTGTLRSRKIATLMWTLHLMEAWRLRTEDVSQTEPQQPSHTPAGGVKWHKNVDKWSPL